jgi:glucose/arabinose dehydrogenase
MNKLLFMPIAATLAGVISFGTADKITKPAKKNNDGSTAAITKASAALPLDKIKMPAGFFISVYAEVAGARSMAMSPSGVLFVGTQRAGKVYAVKDADGDNIADKKWEITSGMNNPNGVALKNGALYVAEISKVTKFPDIEKNLDAPGKGEVIYDKFPTEWAHGWKYIAFGPDGTCRLSCKHRYT